MLLRQINIKDKSVLKSIYFDSIISIDEKIYSPEQKYIWSSQAWVNPEFDNTIIKGKGWVLDDNSNLKGFAIRHPKNKLALLYCRNKDKRKGNGTILLKKIEDDAKKDNVIFIETDASLISFKLLLKNNWKIIHEEKIIIKNTSFVRFKMNKKLI